MIRQRSWKTYIGVALIIIALTIIKYRHSVSTTFFAHAFAPPKTVLLVGLDDSGKRADAIICAYFTGDTPRLLIIPRDTVTENGRKLNGRWQEGAANFKSRVESILGHKIDHYFVVPFKKFPRFLTEAFPSGLSVPVPYRLHYTDHHGGFSYDIPAGRQVLHTKDLMALLRDRYSDPKKRGEAARVANWKRFAISAREELSKPSQLPHLLALANTAQHLFVTDMGTKKVLSLMHALASTSDLSVSYLPAISYYKNHTWLTKINSDAAQSQAHLALMGITIPPGTSIWVLNGTSNAGLAFDVNKELENRFGIPSSAGNTYSTAHTLVEYSKPELYDLASEVAKDLHVPFTQMQEVYIPTTKTFVSARADIIRVALGRDFNDSFLPSNESNQNGDTKQE